MRVQNLKGQTDLNPMKIVSQMEIPWMGEGEGGGGTKIEWG